MKYLGFLILLLLSSSSLKAQQAPGLMGKKLSFFANLNMLNNWNASRFNAANKKTSSEYQFHHYLLTYSLRYDLEAEYNLARNKSVGLSYGFLQTGISPLDSLHSRNLYAHHYALHFKLYETKRSGSIAPLGSYLQAKVFGISSILKQQALPSLDEESTILLNHFNPAISIGIGQQRILYKTVLLNFGLDLGLVIPFQNKNALEKEVYKRLLRQHLLKFRIGIGIPIFPIDQKRVSLPPSDY